jgi:hypothetical protein
MLARTSAPGVQGVDTPPAPLNAVSTAGLPRDMDTVAALLAEDAVFSMPPWTAWWRGRETIAGFTKETCAEARLVATHANGQLAVANAETGRFVASAIDVLTFEGTLIKDITAFALPELFPTGSRLRLLSTRIVQPPSSSSGTTSRPSVLVPPVTNVFISIFFPP